MHVVISYLFVEPTALFQTLPECLKTVGVGIGVRAFPGVLSQPRVTCRNILTDVLGPIPGTELDGR